MIEQVARTSAEQLRAGTTGDVVAGLADLHVRQARHRRRTRMVAAASLVVAVGLGVGAGTLIDRTDDAGPAPSHRPAPSQRHAPLPGSHAAICASPLVTCRDDGAYGFALERPVVWALPPGFGANSGSGATSVSVESYREAPPGAGVTVLERVRAAAPDGGRPARGVARSPGAFVDWVSTRPFLDARPVTRTTLDGHSAWTVRVTLARGAGPGRALCIGRQPCHAITAQPGGGTTGIWGDMSAQYTALYLPGAGTTVVWSWVFHRNPVNLGPLEEAVHSVSWPAG